MFSPYMHNVKLQTTSCPKPPDQIQPNFKGMFLGWLSLKTAEKIESMVVMATD